jgi:hypothetical protein
MSSRKSNLKEQALHVSLAMIAFSLFQVNKNLSAHVKSCEETSKRNQRILWAVLLALISEVSIKLINMVHIG